LVVVSPGLSCGATTLVVKAKDGCSVMRFVRQTAKRLELKSLNPSLPIACSTRDSVECRPHRAGAVLTFSWTGAVLFRRVS